MTATTALYRRYRPDSFADVIGQEHVTEPLMMALRKNRVNHAYLFSGPRGCGKTTSARILARCLNCAQGPTDTPCGTCPSCVELARGGSGSLDVIEIDAASHGGVDDARDLRERATYAPVRDRYKIFIIDEAHMVTSAGFNALLKIVEEPPEHIKFIFATTEPEKVIGTIRSRTHHYPFRLVPPEPLMAYLELICNQENVPVAPGVLSLVVRAGGGSVRDSLSVLDQLMAGAGPDGLDYELAVALLGYTHASLLDDVVEAIAASDAATVFRGVDRVIQTGHDPRRFVEDLLERFRDLIVVQAMPESAQTILRGLPADQIARLQNQAHNLGAAELSRAADVTNTALTEMTGATSPRLHLELLCARVLLPGSEQTERGIAARIDRVERRLNYAGNDVGASVPAGAAGPARPARPVPAFPAAVPEPAPVEPSREAAPASGAPADPRTRAVEGPATGSPAAAAPATSGPAATGDVEVMRRAWPEILQSLSKIKRSTWALVEPNAQVGAFDGQVLTLSFTTTGLAGAFGRADHSENLRQAVHKTVGIDCQITAVAGGAGNEASSAPNPKVPVSRDTPASSADVAWGLAPAGGASTPAPGVAVPPVPAAGAADSPPPPGTTVAPAEPAGPVGTAAAAPGPPVPAPMAVPTDGSFAYSEDDWGPPRDEDAPSLEEEPPVDWVPSAAGDPPAAHVGDRPLVAGVAAGVAASAQADVPQDPWSKAVEQAPGVWVIGPETNVGKSLETPVAVEAVITSPAPGYEAAAAQAPQASPASNASEADASWGLQPAPSAGVASGAPQAERKPETDVPEPAEDREYAMSSAGSAGAALQPAPAASQAESAARQSLYQRLSNSPEAEAGRAKAPTRAAATRYVQDISSADDETIEESGVFGRAAVERILGGKLIEERFQDGSPAAPPL